MRLLLVLVFILTCLGAYSATRIATPIPDPPPQHVESASSITANTRHVTISFYAEFDVPHTKAAGTGTFKDPLTFASPDGPGAYPMGTRIYVPMLKRYFSREGSCVTPHGCGPVTHVQLYLGNPSATRDVLMCEDRLTPFGPSAIVINPPDGLITDLVPMWDDKTRTCHASSKH